LADKEALKGYLVVHADIYVDDISVLQLPAYYRLEENRLHVRPKAGVYRILSFTSREVQRQALLALIWYHGIGLHDSFEKVKAV
jgi:hypothetical protein